jgi:hypothetical protein
MANNQGTLIISPIRPYSSGDTYATAFSSEIKGGHHSVSGITERDNIPEFRREIGMLCTTYTTNTTYQLQNGTGNTDWVVFSSGGGGSVSGITISETGGETLTGITQINFVNYNGTNNVRVLPGGGLVADIWIEAPSFTANFVGARNYSVNTSRYVGEPTTEGDPYNIGDWFGSLELNNKTVRDSNLSSNEASYGSSAEFNIETTDTTFEAIFIDATGGTVVNRTVTLNGNQVFTQESGITITVTNWGDDPAGSGLQYKGEIVVLFDLDYFIPLGGRYSTELKHNNASKGTLTYTDTDLYRDTENTTAIISGNVDLTTGTTTITKWISGVEYYTLGSQWKIDVDGIDELNDRSFPSSEQMDLIETDLAVSDINNINNNEFIDWTDKYDISGVSYSNSTWTINQSNLTIISTNAGVNARVYDWGLANSKISNNLSVLIDTRTDDSDRNSETFNGESERLQSDLSTSWDSGSTLQTQDGGDGLQLFNGRLIYPQTDFSVYEPNSGDTNTNYTGETGDRFYYRAFVGDGSDSTNGLLQFGGSFNVTETDITNYDVNIRISIDSGSTWYNVNDPYTSGIVGDGDGCRTNKGASSGDDYRLDSSNSSTRGLQFTFGGGFTKYIFIEIKYTSTASSRYIDSIDITESNWD